MPLLRHVKLLQILLAFSVCVGMLSFGVHAVLAARGIEFSDDADPISNDKIRSIRGVIAEDTEAPSIIVNVVPEGLIAPGRDMTLVAIPENFGDAERYHMAYCVDGMPLTHVNAGSEDELLYDEDGIPYLENPYGRISASQGDEYAVCDADYLNRASGFVTGDSHAAGQVGSRAKRGRPAFPSELSSAGKILPLDRPELPPRLDERWTGFTRITRVDSDDDGMDDDWEMAMFAGRLRPGVSSDTPLAERFYPTERQALLEAVEPLDDPDEDGWRWDYDYEEMPILADWQIVGATPETPGTWELFYTKPFQHVWQMGVPYVFIPERTRGQTLGQPMMALGQYDGATELTGFTNIHEYTFGLDPLSSDTDGDDVVDGKDVTGFKQPSLAIPVNKKSGESYRVQVHAFTLNSQWRTAQLHAFQLPANGADAIDPPPNGQVLPSRYRDIQSRKYVRVDYEDEVQVSTGAGLQLTMARTPVVVTNKTSSRLGDDRIRIEAVPITESDRSTLEYNWFLNGEFQEEASGYGKRFLLFNVDDPNPEGQVLNVCEEHRVSVSVTDPATNASASDFMSVPIAPAIEFEKSIVDHVERSASGVSGVGGDIARGVDVRQGARKGDIVQFDATLLGVAATKEAAEASGDQDQQTCAQKGITMDQLTFRWSFDTRESQDQTGRGVEASRAQFEILDEAISTAQGADRQFEEEYGSGHLITLDVFGPNGELLTSIDERVVAVGPSVRAALSAETLEVNSNAAAEVLGLAEDINYLVQEEDEVTVRAVAEFFNPDDLLTLEIYRNGVRVSQEPLESDDQSFTFQVGAAGVTEDLEVRVVSSGGDVATQVIRLRVATSDELQTVLERRSLVGALTEFVPDSIRTAFGVALGAAALVAVLLIVMRFTQLGARSATANVADPRYRRNG